MKKTISAWAAFWIAGVAIAAPEPRFEAQVLDEELEIGYGLAIGDVDGDGKPDILLADKQKFYWYRNGDWQAFLLAENLTAKDNVCIAARDVDGDGKVEIAVGAQWNPGETEDVAESGAVYYLTRPKDPTDPWPPVRLSPHDPTVHRMRWVCYGPKKYGLAVLPLHGKGNKDGKGEEVKLRLYRFPENPNNPDGWQSVVIHQEMHKTHNFDVAQLDPDPEEEIIVGGAEGLIYLDIRVDEDWTSRTLVPPINGGVGEVRWGNLGKKGSVFLASIDPMHGNKVMAYFDPVSVGEGKRLVQMTDQLNQGHALACGDFLGMGHDQIVAGWRTPDKQKKVGIKIFIPQDAQGLSWKEAVIDHNKMACEDLQVADLDGDGKLDIVAAGRATRNLIIYWNRSGGGR